MGRSKKDLLKNISGYKKAKFIDNDTLEVIYNNGSRVIQFHDTNILTFTIDDKIIVNTDGWLTVTTKDRINRFSNLYVYQKNNQWFINNYFYYDGIVFDSKGNLISKEKKDNSKKIQKMKKKISKYCNLITKDNLPFPSSGDCWYCLLRNEDNKTMGNFSNNNFHLTEHLKESYLHGSILINAMQEYGYRNDQIALCYHMKLIDYFKRGVRKYLYKRLLVPILVN